MSPTIIVADDELPIAQLIEDVLREEGYTVYVATDGRQALNLARTVRPDLLLCDIMMPVMSGDEVRLALGADAHTRHIPVVLMSAATARQRDPQATLFLAKPFELDQLLDVIARVLGP